MLATASIVTVWNFEILSIELHVAGLCTSGNYKQKWIRSCIFINLNLLIAPPYAMAHIKNLHELHTMQRVYSNCMLPT